MSLKSCEQKPCALLQGQHGQNSEGLVIIELEGEELRTNFIRLTFSAGMFFSLRYLLPEVRVKYSLYLI